MCLTHRGKVGDYYTTVWSGKTPLQSVVLAPPRGKARTTGTIVLPPEGATTDKYCSDNSVRGEPWPLDRSHSEGPILSVRDNIILINHWQPADRQICHNGMECVPVAGMWIIGCYSSPAADKASTLRCTMARGASRRVPLVNVCVTADNGHKRNYSTVNILKQFVWRLECSREHFKIPP